MDRHLTNTVSRPIDVEFRKYDGGLHWHWTAHDLGADEHGRWLYAPAGTEYRRGDEPVKVAPSDFVKLVRPDAWWTAVWNNPPRTFQVYVDIISPAVWDGNRVCMVDLDLDVVRTEDGQVEVLDEDEFLEHSAAMDYPERIVDAARSATAWVAMRVESGAAPFDGTGNAKLEQARQMIDDAARP